MTEFIKIYTLSTDSMSMHGAVNQRMSRPLAHIHRGNAFHCVAHNMPCRTYCYNVAPKFVQCYKCYVLCERHQKIFMNIN